MAFKQLKTQRLNLNILLYTTPGIEATISFLQNTDISIRKWHLERREEEEEEEKD